MDVHLVHKSADGKMAVIAVRMNIEVGEANAELATLWQHLPTTVGATGKDHGHGESRWTAAGRPRVLDLRWIVDRAALHGECTVVHLRKSNEHQ